jgi:stalled ribosome rescue protein Dom34
VPTKRRPRGYPVAVLIGLEDNKATFWDVYSKEVRPAIVLNKLGNNYTFYECIVNELRPITKRGVNTVLLASDSRKIVDLFMEHIEKHQGWMLKGYELNRVTFEYLEGSAIDVKDITTLVNESRFKKKIRKAMGDNEGIVMSVVERRLTLDKGTESLKYSLEEVEEAVYTGENVEYIITTQSFEKHNKRRVQRLFQVAEKKGFKTNIIPFSSPYNNRIEQLGGIICLMRIP